jgi:hypothetical protein
MSGRAGELKMERTGVQEFPQLERILRPFRKAPYRASGRIGKNCRNGSAWSTQYTYSWKGQCFLGKLYTIRYGSLGIGSAWGAGTAGKDSDHKASSIPR